MELSKNRILIGLVILQTVFILFLIHKAIAIRNGALFARTEADYYKKALEEISESEEALFDEILQQREELLREYKSTLETARRHGLKIELRPHRATPLEQRL
jgi:flagellar motor component MotA